MTGAPLPGYRQEPGVPSTAVPPALREVGFDQHLDRTIPLDTEFRDDRGRTVQLGELFGTRPVVMAFVYYDCPMLCTMVLGSITSSLNVLSFDAGRDFDVIMVSFDPRETPVLAASKKAEHLRRYDRPGAGTGWHFLTGDQPSIDRLTHAAGFRYAWDEETQQFAHPAGLIVLTPDGRLSRYLFGLDYSPRDLRLALVEASEGRIGSAVDAALLYCYHYDPMTGRYGLVVMRLVRIAGVATLLALGTFIVVMVRRDRTRHEAPGTWPGSSSTRHEAPGTRHEAPGTRRGSPSTRHEAPGTRPGSSSTRHEAPGTWPGSSSTRHEAPGTRHL